MTLKLLFILVLFFFMGPVVTHALAQAALHAGIKPQLVGGPHASGWKSARREGRQP